MIGVVTGWAGNGVAVKQEILVPEDPPEGDAL
jgi:hypothetical protein